MEAQYNSPEQAQRLIELVVRAFDSLDFRDEPGMTSDNLIVETLHTDVSFLASCVAERMSSINGRCYPYDKESIIEHIRSECNMAA